MMCPLNYISEKGENMKKILFFLILSSNDIDV